MNTLAAGEEAARLAAEPLSRQIELGGINAGPGARDRR